MEVATRNEIWHKGSLGDENDTRMSNTCIVCDTTLDNEKYDVLYNQRCPIGKNMTDGT